MLCMLAGVGGYVLNSTIVIAKKGVLAEVQHMRPFMRPVEELNFSGRAVRLY